ncbi:MAG: Nif3-like dinuclear metal center hexameric protein, partial [Eggerthella sp.]|nr:Nif3-like dinuclear metal center hexameric protein [Eggerthella sp.]
TSVFGRAPRIWGDFPRELDRVVTCTGSAGDLGRACLRAQVDCLVCGEIKYHDALELSQAGLAVVDLGHDTSELPLAAVLAAAVENAGIPGDLVTVLDQGDNWSYPETVRV